MGVILTSLITTYLLNFFIANGSNKKTEDNDLKYINAATDTPSSTGLYNAYWIVEGHLPIVPPNPSDFATILVRKLLCSVATGETYFTISSAEELKAYADISNYYVNVQDGYLSMPPPLVGLPGYTIPTSHKEYPYNFSYNITISAGWHSISFTGMEYVGDYTYVYGVFAYFKQARDYSSTPYRCELKLTGDISVSRSEFSRFRNFGGIFNGDGHTITFTGDDRTSMVTSGSDGCVFKSIASGAVVKNTKFKNLKAYLADSLGDFAKSVFVGGICGKNSGTIEKCIVENCEFMSDKYRTRAHVAPIAGNNQGTVKNCLLLGTYKVGADGANFLSNWDGITSFYFVVTKDIGGEATVSANKAKHCVYRMTAEKFWNNENCKDHIKKPGDTENVSDHTECYSSTTGKFAKLSKSATGGKYESTPWYYCEQYSTWPMLRIFMNWQTISFSVSSGGSVSPNSILIPNDYSLSNLGDRGAVTSMTILGQTISASPTNSDYKVVSWTRSNRTYTVKFSRKLCTLAFLTDGVTSQINKTGNTYYDVYEGAQVKVTNTPYPKQGYSVITYKFTAVVENGDSYTETSTTVKYTLKDTKYYLTANESKYLSNFNAAPGAANNIKISANLKSYKVELG